MASKQEFVDFIVSQIKSTAEIKFKHMFGEYGLFANGKIFALICDNKLFIKPTKAGHTFIQDPT